MIAISLIGIGVILAIVLTLVAYSANQRKRGGQSGMDAVNNQRDAPKPRASGLD